MEETYRGGTISAYGKKAIITFRSGWGDPGDWIINFYREGTLCETVTRAEEDTTPKDVITRALAFVGYDEMALAKDVAFLALSRKKVQKEADRLSDLCSQDVSFESISEQLRITRHVAEMSSVQCRSIERHIAVYKAVRQVGKRL